MNIYKNHQIKYILNFYVIIVIKKKKMWYNIIKFTKQLEFYKSLLVKVILLRVRYKFYIPLIWIIMSNYKT